MDPALWALLSASAALAFLWYRNRPQEDQNVGPELHPTTSPEPAESWQVQPFSSKPAPPPPDEWTLTAAETVGSRTHRRR